MLAFAIRRILTMIPVLLFLTALIFVLTTFPDQPGPSGARATRFLSKPSGN